MLNEKFYLNSDDENSLKYYQERANWCNENNATIQEIEENYQDDNVEKTRTASKSFRQFQIVAIPELTEEEIQASKRAERDSAINAIMWRIERYKQQKELDIETSDSEETYLSILAYVQYLRDFTKKENWWNLTIMTFDKWDEN